AAARAEDRDGLRALGTVGSIRRVAGRSLRALVRTRPDRPPHRACEPDRRLNVLEPLTIISADGVELQAEYRSAQGEAHDVAQAACVLCHPHPQYGGSMHSLVI